MTGDGVFLHLRNQSAWRVGHRGMYVTFLCDSPLLQMETVLPTGLSLLAERRRALAALGPEPSWKNPSGEGVPAPPRAPGALMRVTRRCRVGNSECQSGHGYKSSRTQVETGTASGKRGRSPAWLSADPAESSHLVRVTEPRGLLCRFALGNGALG